MGTSLTGLTPATTYDALIKVGDNGPLSATAKYIGDGLGNDSALALSTARVGVGTASPSFPFHVLGSAGTIARITDGTSHIDFYSGSGLSEISAATTMLLSTSATERMRITSSGNVGIGTSAPSAELQVNKASDVTLALSNSSAVTSGNRGSLAFYNSGISTVALIKATAVTDNVGTQLEFYTRPAAGSLAQTMTIASTGNVGIGTSSPYTSLTIGNSDATAEISSGGSNTHLTLKTVGASGALRVFTIGGGTNTLATTETMRITSDGYLRMASGTGGIQFNGDTADANALDDYEEGTFTLSVVPATSGTISLSTNSARYTKIGRQVFVQAFITVSSVSSPIGTAILFQGLPFTIANATNAGGSSMVVWADASVSYVKTVLPGFYLGNTTQIYAPIDASLVQANDEFFITMTYTV